MAKYVIARQLSGKKIISDEGEDVGRIVDLEVDEISGKIETLVVEPNPDSTTTTKMKKQDGMIYISYEAVKAVGDYVIVEKRNMN